MPLCFPELKREEPTLCTAYMVAGCLQAVILATLFFCVAFVGIVGIGS